MTTIRYWLFAAAALVLLAAGYAAGLQEAHVSYLDGYRRGYQGGFAVGSVDGRQGGFVAGVATGKKHPDPTEWVRRPSIQFMP